MFDFVSTSQSHALCGGRARSKLQTPLVIIMPPHLAAIHAYGLLVQAQHRYPFRMQVRSGLTSGGGGLFQALSLKPAILMEAGGNTGIARDRGFADSPLEEIGFELVVPCRAASRQGPTNCPAIIIAVDDRNYLQT